MIDLSPPANLDAEFSLVGALLYDPTVAEMNPSLKGKDFSEPALGRVWETCIDLIREHQMADPTLVWSRHAEDPGVHELGGLSFLADAIEKAPPSSSTMALAADVLNCSRLRRLADLAIQIRHEARLGADAFSLLADAEREMTSLLQDAAPPSANLIDAKASAAVTVARIDAEAEHGRPKGAMTTLRCFDRRMRGLRPGWLVVIAGRPSMGKTALARAAAFGCARRNLGSKVLFFALEMERDELDVRSLSQLTREMGDPIAYKDMSGDLLPPEERATLAKAQRRIPENLLIDDSPILSIDYVRRRVLALKRQGPIAAVFIDYLQIMERPDAKGRNEASVIGEMTKGLKQLAREAHTCIVLLSQINRGVESRDDKRPQLSDLRESGAIEQDANAVFFAYREAYYIERSEPKPGASQDKVRQWEMDVHACKYRLDVICAKVRQAAVGTDAQHYEPAYDYVVDPVEDPAR